MSNQIPQDWFCPICQEVMKDPVIGPDGFTYERSYIEQWLEKNNTSPVTRKEMDSKNLIPNLALKSTIENMLPEYLKNGASIKLSEEQAKIKSNNINPIEDELQLDVDTIVDNGELVVNVSIEPPSEQTIEKRKNVSIICVLDVSGSMDTEASEANGA
jgi:uncharacterized sporulation protein YeaH/YhbH (DUF444 family)